MSDRKSHWDNVFRSKSPKEVSWTQEVPETSLQIILWHDRAAFHFLTNPEEIQKYIQVARQTVKGFLTLATFSDKGPKKCSGLPIRQYSEEIIQKELSDGFNKIECITEDHITPFGSKQNFLYCSFRKAPAETKSVN
jgi:hypothetical protein